jgi:DNA-binding NarL/FixJ family response regulator
MESEHRRRRNKARETRERLGRRLFTDVDWLGLACALRLSKRQVEIAKLVCEELTYAGMASRLSISINTVRMHMHALFVKLGVRDRIGVVLRLALTQRRLPGPDSKNPGVPT